MAWAATLAGCLPHDILDFSASINPLGPPVRAIAAIKNHLQDLRAYPDPNYRELCARLAQLHQLPTDWILPGNGAAELLTWAGRELAELTTTYLVTPGFADYPRALEAFAAPFTCCRLRFPLPNLEGREPVVLPSPVIQLQDALQEPGLLPIEAVAAGLLLNNPHNPTGHLYLQQEVQSYLERFALVVVDEAFMDFLVPEEQQSVLGLVPHYPNLVIVRSLTKFYSLPGLRLGYAIAHPERLRRWQRWRDPWPVNTLAVAAAIAVLSDQDFQAQTWNWLPPAREQLYQGLAQLPGLEPYPGAANFLLVQSQHAVASLQEQLLQQSRILIRDCLSFPELGDRYFRVAVRTPAENQRLLESLAKILGSAWV